jgi:hypothetical protein
MRYRLLTHAGTFAVLLVALLGSACVQSESFADGDGGAPARPSATAATPQAPPALGLASTSPGGATTPAPTADGATASGTVTFTGDRDETERFIRYFQTIELTPEQERIKVEALSTIPAPCCADNPLATCCCPCNMAKAAWGLSAWLITERGYGADEVNRAAKDWLAVANPGGFTGNACYSGGCGRPIHENGCGGMDDRRVL